MRGKQVLSRYEYKGYIITLYRTENGVKATLESINTGRQQRLSKTYDDEYSAKYDAEVYAETHDN